MKYCGECARLSREYDRRTGLYYRCGVNGYIMAHRKKEGTLARDGILRPKWCGSAGFGF